MKANGEDQFLNTMHRTLSSVAVHQGLVIASDFSGCVHCLDADTGRKYWTFDALAAIWSTPLIVGDAIYIADEDGTVSQLCLSPDPRVALGKKGKFDVYEPLERIDMKGWITSSPIFANDVLYVATRNKLHAIANSSPPAKNLEQSVRTREVDDAQAPRRKTARVARSIFAPTPQDVVEQMLAAADISKGDTVVDLGSGDGRILVTAAKRFGARAIGYEIDPDLVKTARLSAQAAGVPMLVDVREQDMYTADLSSADAVTVFLYPATLQALEPLLAKMKAGSRLISHHYEIPGRTPEQSLTIDSKESGGPHRVFVYVVQ